MTKLSSSQLLGGRSGCQPNPATPCDSEERIDACPELDLSETNRLTRGEESHFCYTRGSPGNERDRSTRSGRVLRLRCAPARNDKPSSRGKACQLSAEAQDEPPPAEEAHASVGARESGTMRAAADGDCTIQVGRLVNTPDSAVDVAIKWTADVPTLLHFFLFQDAPMQFGEACWRGDVGTPLESDGVAGAGDRA